MAANLLKRLYPETSSHQEPVSNKRSRNVMFDFGPRPFDDDDSVFREFLMEQNLPRDPDIIYLSEDEPEEEEEEEWRHRPRLGLPLIEDHDSTTPWKLMSLNNEADLDCRLSDGSVSNSQEFLDQEQSQSQSQSLLMYPVIADISDLDECRDVQQWMSRLDRLFLEGQQSVPSSGLISFSETSPLQGVAGRCRDEHGRSLLRASFGEDHLTMEQHARCSKAASGSASIFAVEIAEDNFS